VALYCHLNRRYGYGASNWFSLSHKNEINYREANTFAEIKAAAALPPAHECFYCSPANALLPSPYKSQLLKSPHHLLLRQFAVCISELIIAPHKERS